MKSYVIFICGYDPFGMERYRYTFGNRCLEVENLPLGDETVKIIVNTKGTDGDISAELKNVLFYLDYGITSSEYTRQLDDAVRTVKCSEERRHEYMVMMIHEMEVREEGREEGRILVLNSLVKDGVLTLTDAAKRANMTPAEFQGKAESAQNNHLSS